MITHPYIGTCVQNKPCKILQNKSECQQNPTYLRKMTVMLNKKWITDFLWNQKYNLLKKKKKKNIMSVLAWWFSEINFKFGTPSMRYERNLI